MKDKIEQSIDQLVEDAKGKNPSPDAIQFANDVADWIKDEFYPVETLDKYEGQLEAQLVNMIVDELKVFVARKLTTNGWIYKG